MPVAVAPVEVLVVGAVVPAATSNSPKYELAPWHEVVEVHPNTATGSYALVHTVTHERYDLPELNSEFALLHMGDGESVVVN